MVGFRLADKFNGVICMDLKEYIHNKIWILHIIDAATRYSAACLINTKDKNVVVSRIFQIWVGCFGAPKKIHTDNGGEFVNQVLEEMNEKLGIVTQTTPAESPFSNGVIERHHVVVYESMVKTMEDTKCDAAMALAWSVSAKKFSSECGWVQSEPVGVWF